MLLLVIAPASRADTCEDVAVACTERGDLEVDGVLLIDVCLAVQKTSLCLRDEPTDFCQPFTDIEVTGEDPLGPNQCRQLTETCLQMEAGLCGVWERTYECLNGPSDAPGATLLDREFENFTESFASTCETLEADPACSLFSSNFGHDAGTQTFNELDVTRSWWIKNNSFDCTPPGLEDTCEEIADQPICQRVGEGTCEAWNSLGDCIAQTETYRCEGDASFEASCEATVCVGDACVGMAPETTDSYAQSAAWLHFLDQLSDENSCTAEDIPPEGEEIESADCVGGTFDLGHDEPEVFAGTHMRCTRGFYNCCDGDGEGQCSAAEERLASIRQAGAAIYNYKNCTRTILLGTICVEYSDYYCAYGSKFARVFQEQVDLQTGAQVNRNAPRCPGLTIEQLEQIDVSSLDLSEVFGDMLEDAQEPVEELVIERMSQELGGFQLDVQETFE